MARAMLHLPAPIRPRKDPQVTPRKKPRPDIAVLLKQDLPLTITEAASVVGVSHDTIRKAIAAGSLAALRVGWQRRVLPSALWAFAGREAA